MGNYSTKKISDSLTLINEGDNPFMAFTIGLVVGSERALLIDTANGDGELDKFAATLTEKPITCVLTHGHPDHVGGAHLFGDLRMSKLDDALLPKPLNYVDISDGEVFDLGGVTLKTIAVPGHTKGSMTFYNEAESYCLVSDAINAFLWMWLDGCEPIEVYKQSLLRFKSLVPTDTLLFCGHSMEPLPDGIVDTLITICDEILAGNTADDPPFTPPFPGMNADGAKVRSLNGINVVYREDNIK
jgi:glyoxylase-like metal-dependent hydrolase (beta-lactamase superfamily II)